MGRAEVRGNSASNRTQVALGGRLLGVECLESCG